MLFDGFAPANTTPVPDILFDELLSVLSGAELKVLLYIIRRTLGFKKSCDAISFSQFEHGITCRDGKVLDRGCGLSRETISRALQSLEKSGCITSIKRDTSSGDSDITVYQIRFKAEPKKEEPKEEGGGDEGSRKKRPPVVGKNDHPGRKKRPPVVGKNDQGVVGLSDPQETVTTRNSNTRNSITDTVVADATAPAQNNSLQKEEGPQRRRSATEEALLADLPPLARQVAEEWCGIFTRKRVPVTPTLVGHAKTLAEFDPEPGEIRACREWMYDTDEKKWYSRRGMNLGHVVREFENFRSLASVPQRSATGLPVTPPDEPAEEQPAPAPPKGMSQEEAEALAVQVQEEASRAAGRTIEAKASSVDGERWIVCVMHVHAGIPKLTVKDAADWTRVLQELKTVWTRERQKGGLYATTG